MRPTTLRALAGSALLSLAAQPAGATSDHRHFHHRHSGNHTHGSDLDLVKRGRLVNRSGQCEFPQDAGLVTITPSKLNAGWALSPDQECTAGSYCPYACPPGQLMNQWKPGSTYVYPDSMDGGAYCDKSGKITKPFPSKDYCVDGVGNVQAVNNCGDIVAVCQTVLPGNEAMLIPTSVHSSAVISVPGTSYWDSTAAHFYVNQPGYSTDEACLWGDGSSAIGNWAAYVIGTNQDATGYTYVKAAWNPIYTNAFPGVKPNFGVKIECDGTCVGLPCSIDPSTDGFGGVNSAEAATGAGGADFCVVTVTSGSARVVFFNTDGSTGTSSSVSSAAAAPKPATTEAQPTPSEAAINVLGLQAAAATSSTSSSSTTTEISNTLPSTTLPSLESTTAENAAITSLASATSAPTTSRRASSTLARSSAVPGGVFQENDGTANGTLSSGSAGITSSSSLADSTAAAPATTTSSKSNASKDQTAFGSLVVAIVAAACLY